jgi:hypothetical protein
LSAAERYYRPRDLVKPGETIYGAARRSAEERRRGSFSEPRLSAFSDFAKITAFDEGNKFIPFGMRQSNHVRILADCDLVIGYHDFGALRAKRTQRKSDGFHRGPP